MNLIWFTNDPNVHICIFCKRGSLILGCFFPVSILNEDFENVCNWFVDNKLSIHFGDDKTKSILFTSKRRSRNICNLNIRCKEINIKLQAQVTYLGCVLDESMSGEPMVLKVVNKTNGKRKFLRRKK